MNLSGIIPPIVTPLDDQERVDEIGLTRLLKRLLQAGVHGIFVLGSTGEFAHLSDDEKRRTIDITLTQVNKTVPVLIGVTDSGTKRAISWANEVQKMGAEIIVSAPPFYYQLTEADAERHFRLLASETNLKILLYNTPSTTKVHLSVDLVFRLADMPNIIGIKDSSGDFAFFLSLLDAFKDKDFSLLQGHDALLAHSLLCGANGGINASANLVAEWFVALYQAIQQKDFSRGLAWQQKINSLLQDLKNFPFLSALKEGLSCLGLIKSYTSAPFSSLNDEQRLQLHQILRHHNIKG